MPPRLPAYLHALTGKSVHVVTVNDYLARRDSEWMGQIHRFLGMTTGCVLPDLAPRDRRQAYTADITYATNNELGFDYLRDNMKYQSEDMVQRGHHFAIIDEVDSILIDEARTPLIISGPLEEKIGLYTTINDVIITLRPEDYDVDEKDKLVTLSEIGNEHIESLLREGDTEFLAPGTSLYDIQNVAIVHHIKQALHARHLLHKDRNYIVKNDQVVIVDEFTGRTTPGRRYSEGLHQALEAKEGVSIQPENQTFASVTFQNYFRLYETLSGMTGTAETEAEEFADIYSLDVVSIPTNVETIRTDHDDEVYRSAEEKNLAIIATIENCHARGQPVLVGTTSIEKSELLSDALDKKKIPHNVLNARYHEQEARIISQAGVPKAVTIATNMAGRGTDIQLGGNPEMVDLETIDGSTENSGKSPEDRRRACAARHKEVCAAGGLYVISTERHESRRIDNQLRGRAGRQGDPGVSKFFVSLEDDLMRIFGSARLDKVLHRIGLQKGQAIIHPWINKALEKAQRKIESHNFEIRKNLLKFDNVVNDQRKVIFEQRLNIIHQKNVSDIVTEMRHAFILNLVHSHIPENSYPEQWDVEALEKESEKHLSLSLPLSSWAGEEGITPEAVEERIRLASDQKMAVKVTHIGPDVMRRIEKTLLLHTIDHNWREHLQSLEHLRRTIGLRGYGQRDPLNEYKTESFMLFEGLLDSLRGDVTRKLAQVELSDPTVAAQEEKPHPNQRPQAALIDGSANGYAAPAAAHRSGGGALRNSPCPCGSGKKYKHCHGRVI